MSQPPPLSASRPLSRDDLRAPYVTMLVVGAVSLILLVLGLTNLIEASMPWAHTGAHVQVIGVYAYDPQTHALGPAGSTFPRGKPFAARVDWASLPPSLDVQAVWYDPHQTAAGGSARAGAADLAAEHAIAPVTNVKGPPGTYTLLVLHYVGKKPIEILGRQYVQVTS